MTRTENTYVTASEVSSLKHELWDNSVESRACISETLLSGAKSTEVLCSAWSYDIVKVEVDTTVLDCL